MPRNSQESSIGVLNFIEFALDNTKTPEKIKCLCKKCYFRKTLISCDVFDHLLLIKGGGFLQGYTTCMSHAWGTIPKLEFLGT